MINIAARHPQRSTLVPLIDRAFGQLRYLTSPEHSCRGNGPKRPTAVPARFVLACDNGHLDDFPWQYFVHRGTEPDSGHSLKLSESGSTGEAASIFVTCDCGARRPMSEALGQAALGNLPMCRGRHPHLGQYEDCDSQTRTLALGATNSWFAMQLRAFSIPLASNVVDQLVSEFWGQLQLLAALPESTAKGLMRTQKCWAELEPYGADKAWEAIGRHARALASGPVDDTVVDERDLLRPEWAAFATGGEVDLLDFTTRREERPSGTEGWLDQVVLVPRLREVAALYGFTRIDAPEWGDVASADPRG